MQIENEKREEIEKFVTELRELYSIWEDRKAHATELFHLIEAEEAKLQFMLEELDSTDYEAVKKKLKVSLNVKVWANVPKGDDREVFFNWLKEKGYYDQYITVHSGSINSLVKEEYEIHKDEEGFAIPGLEIKEKVSVKY